MTNRLKNTALILVGIVILLLAVDYASQKLASLMTENLTYGYSIKLSK